MKRLVAGLVALGMAAGVTWGWMDTPPDEVAGAPLRLVAAETLPDGLGAFVKAYVEKNAKVGVELVSLPVDATLPMDEAARAVAEQAAAAEGAEKAVATLVIVASDDARMVSVRPAEGVAVLNVVRLGGKNLARELLDGRAGQEALRELAILLDVASCPFPLCVLRGYADPAELDEMSDNYCPPCFERVRHAMLTRGGHILAIPD
ncbi:MAG: hypothetical protein IJT88_07225 [Kiritimatiellae bacterium]|nr:hypothetical protein [Kiritimatiellia bacterium]